MKLGSILVQGMLLVFLALNCSTARASSLRLQDTVVNQGVITADTIFWKDSVSIFEDVVLQLSESSVWIVDSSAHVLIEGELQAVLGSQLKISSFDGESLDGRTIFKVFGSGRSLSLQKLSVIGLKYVSPDSVVIDTFSNVNLFGFKELTLDSVFIERNGFSIDLNYGRFGGYGAVKIYGTETTRIGYVYSVDNRAMFRAASLGLYYCGGLSILEGFFARNIAMDTFITTTGGVQTGSGGGGGVYTAFLNSVEIDRCLFINNNAFFGACVIAADTLLLTNSVILQNADGLLTSFGSNFNETMHEVVNCTFYQNEFFDLQVGKQLDIYNSVVVRSNLNDRFNARSLFLGNAPSPRFHNSYRSFDCGQCDDLSGSGVELNSKLFPLLDSTIRIDETMIDQLIPSSFSILVDAGQSSVVTTTQDVYGEDRIQGAAVDIGAFESPFVVSVVEQGPGFDFNLYPNPAATYFEISAADEMSAVRVFDISGRQVVEYSALSVRDVRLPLPGGLASGLYNVQVWFVSGGVYSKPVLIH
ncbi:MAG: choice-of-anchor Q domain-containing protein [Saprospiraceae bacterium]